MTRLGSPSRRKRLLGSSALLAGALAMLTMLVAPPRAAFAQAAPAAAPRPVATIGEQDSLTQAQLEQCWRPSRCIPTTC